MLELNFTDLGSNEASPQATQDELVRKYHHVCQVLKAAKEAHEELRETLIKMMDAQNRDHLAGPGYYLKCTRFEKSNIDYKSLVIAAEIAPTLVARYTTKSEQARLTLEAAL